MWLSISGWCHGMFRHFSSLGNVHISDNHEVQCGDPKLAHSTSGQAKSPLTHSRL